MLRKLVYFTTAFAFVVIVVGAFVRLTDAGLGCPDWPGCYGKITPAHAEEHISKAVEAQGAHGPVSMQKAWHEMGHRYLAGTLGLLILAIAVLAWRQRARIAQSPLLASALVLLVMFQAALGMWTVTLLLKPVIVTLHLLGGMTTFALLLWLALRQRQPSAATEAAQSMRPWAALGLALVIAQIALGGWVSANYAALACIDFPTCHGVWMPNMNFEQGFHLVRELGRTADGAHLSYDALTAIHWTHRVGALVVAVYIGLLVVRICRIGSLRTIALALAMLLSVQILLGITNVLSGLQLPVAVAHNAGAALLLAAMVVLNFALFSRSSR